MLNKKLVHAIINQFSMPTNGIHGITHWARVLENGRRLAEKTGAVQCVVELFAVLHDSKRFDDGFDKGHGPRGAEFALSVRDKLFSISNNNFELLYKACENHANGETLGDITIQTCWDSDRLDLNRITIKPDPEYLCTEPAKNPETIEWASARAGQFFIPDLILDEWGIDFDNPYKS